MHVYPDQMTQALLRHLYQGGGFGYYWIASEAKKEKEGKTTDSPKEKGTYWFPVARPRVIPDEQGRYGPRHIYFGVHPVGAIPHERLNHKTGERYTVDQRYIRALSEEITVVNCLFGEFDTGIAQFDPHPSVIVESSRGKRHCYWLINEPYLLNTEEKRDYAKRLQAGWVRYVSSDDGAKDLARVLRLPGTHNYKADYAPDYPLVSFVEADYSRLYTIEALAEKAQAFIAAPAKASHSHGTQTQTEYERVEDALNRIAPARWAKYGDWIEIGMALHDWDSTRGLSLWDHYSRKGAPEAHEDGKCAEKWGTFRKSGKTIASVFRWADEDSPQWRETTATQAESPSAPQVSTPPPAHHDPGLTKRLADAITQHHHFAIDTGHRLYHYKNGNYHGDGEWIIRQQVRLLLEAWHLTAKWSIRRAEEVAHYITLVASGLWSCPPTDRLNVLNGIVEVDTRQLIAHSPDFLSSVQLPVTFDPQATCPHWERFITTTFPEDTVAAGVAWQLVAWLMTPDTSIQKAVLLSGEGSNGKSTFLSALVAFLGRKNITAMSLQRLESDRFSAARIVGMLANICPDLPSTHLEETSVFKALTGGDVLTVERKHQESFDILPFCRLIFSSNHPPRSSDATHAFFRRWLVIPFERSFEGKENIPRKELDAQLADEKELSGVLNKAVAALNHIRQQGITETDSMRAAWNEFRQVTDPLAVWLDRNVVQLPTASIVQRRLLQIYNQDCAKSGRPPMTAHAMTKALKRAYPGLELAQRGVKKEWTWLGIGLRSEIDETDERDHDTHDTHDIHDFSPIAEYILREEEMTPSSLSLQNISHNREKVVNVVSVVTPRAEEDVMKNGSRRQDDSDQRYDDSKIEQARLYIQARNWRKALALTGTLRNADRRKALEAEVIAAQREATNAD